MDTVALLFVLLVIRCRLLPSSSPMELLLIANQLSASQAASRRCFRSVMSTQEAELQTMRLHEELEAEEEVREQHVKQQKQEEVGDSSLLKQGHNGEFLRRNEGHFFKEVGPEPSRVIVYG